MGEGSSNNNGKIRAVIGGTNRVRFHFTSLDCAGALWFQVIKSGHGALTLTLQKIKNHQKLHSGDMIVALPDAAG
jgi:hypothetical protein